MVVNSGFFREEGVSNQAGDKISDKIGKRLMPGVFYLTNIFQFIIDRFNHRTFTKQYLIAEGH